MNDLIINTVNFDINSRIKNPITRLWLSAGYDGIINYYISVDGGLKYFDFTDKLENIYQIENSTNIISIRFVFKSFIGVDNYVTHTDIISKNFAGYLLEFISEKDQKIYTCNVDKNGIFSIKIPIGKYRVRYVDNLLRHKILYQTYNVILNTNINYRESKWGKEAIILQKLENQQLLNNALYDLFEDKLNIIDYENGFNVDHGYLSSNVNDNVRLYWWLLAFD